MLCLESSVKGGFILRTQQAKGLQISIEDKTGGGGSASCKVWVFCGLF